MSEEQIRYIARLEERISTLEQAIGEHRHERDPQWDAWTRMVNHYGRTEWDDHFRSGVIPAGYAWQGAPFGGAPGGAGGTLEYSYRGTYLHVIADAQPHFLSLAVGSYVDKHFIARIDAGYQSICGIRADDGTNNNYAEMRLENQGNHTILVVFSYVTGGVGPTTVSSPAVRSDVPHVLMMMFVNAIPGLYGYTARESGEWDYMTNQGTGVIGWTPSRIGLVFRNNPQIGCCVDLIKNEFV